MLINQTVANVSLTKKNKWYIFLWIITFNMYCHIWYILTVTSTQTGVACPLDQTFWWVCTWVHCSTLKIMNMNVEAIRSFHDFKFCYDMLASNINMSKLRDRNWVQTSPKCLLHILLFHEGFLPLTLNLSLINGHFSNKKVNIPVSLSFVINLKMFFTIQVYFW